MFVHSGHRTHLAEEASGLSGSQIPFRTTGNQLPQQGVQPVDGTGALLGAAMKPKALYTSMTGKNPHPIAHNGDDDDSNVTCVENFGSYGNDLPPGEDPLNYVVDMPLDKNEDGVADGSARIAYDKETYNVTSVETKQTQDHHKAMIGTGVRTTRRTDAMSLSRADPWCMRETGYHERIQRDR